MLMFSDEAIPFEGTSGKEVYQNFDFCLSFLSGNSVSGREIEEKESPDIFILFRECAAYSFLFPLCWDVVDSDSEVHDPWCWLDGEAQNIMRRWQPDHSGSSWGISVISVGRVEFSLALLVICWGYLYEHGGRIFRPAKSLSIDLCGR